MNSRNIASRLPSLIRQRSNIIPQQCYMSKKCPPKPECPKPVESTQPTSTCASNKGMFYLLGTAITAISCGLGYNYYREQEGRQKSSVAGDDYCGCNSKNSCPLVENIPVEGMDESENPSTKCLQKIPTCPNDLPEKVPYLIVGAGTAAYSAFRAIRANDPNAKILVIGEECNLPYMRPPLSKELWYASRSQIEKMRFPQGDDNERSIFYEKDCYYVPPSQLMKEKCGGVAVALGRKVVRLDVEKKEVTLDDGTTKVAYEKLLIATGGKPKQHPAIACASEKVQSRTTLFRKIVDFEKLDCVSLRGKTIAVIGGGFLGSELAVGISQRSKSTKVKVHQIFQEEGNIGKILPSYLSKWTTKQIKEKHGVNVISNVQLNCAKMCDDKIELTLSNNEKLLVDHVVVAIGLEPEVSIAECAGLETDKNRGGYLVSAELLARDNVWVAGDAASFYDVKLGRRRVEHHDHAVVSGRLAGENMTGKRLPYWHQSMFWSDIDDKLSFEAVGLVDNELETQAIFSKDCNQESSGAGEGENDGDKKFDGKGVVFYFNKDKIIVGVLMWNLMNQLPLARKVIGEQKQCDDLAKLAKAFNIHGKDEA